MLQGRKDCGLVQGIETQISLWTLLGNLEMCVGTFFFNVKNIALQAVLSKSQLWVSSSSCVQVWGDSLLPFLYPLYPSL